MAQQIKKPKRIVTTGDKAKRIKTTSKTRRLDPREIADALGAVPGRRFRK